MAVITPPGDAARFRQMVDLSLESLVNDQTEEKTNLLHETAADETTKVKEPEFKTCYKCKLPKPDRAHHCSVCDKCVLKMDHHCPWLTFAVAEKAQPDIYLVKTTYLTLAALYYFLMNVPIFYAELWAHHDIVTAAFSYKGFLFTFLLAGTIVFVVGYLAGYNFYLIVSGQTTIEHSMNSYAKKNAALRGEIWVNEFDLGTYRNMAIFFNISYNRPWWTVFVPMPVPAMGDGTMYLKVSNMLSKDAEIQISNFGPCQMHRPRASSSSKPSSSKSNRTFQASLHNFTDAPNDKPLGVEWALKANLASIRAGLQYHSMPKPPPIVTGLVRDNDDEEDWALNQAIEDSIREACQKGLGDNHKDSAHDRHFLEHEGKVKTSTAEKERQRIDSLYKAFDLDPTNRESPRAQFSPKGLPQFAGSSPNVFSPIKSKSVLSSLRKSSPYARSPRPAKPSDIPSNSPFIKEKTLGSSRSRVIAPFVFDGISKHQELDDIEDDDDILLEGRVQSSYRKGKRVSSKPISRPIQQSPIPTTSLKAQGDARKPLAPSPIALFSDEDAEIVINKISRPPSQPILNKALGSAGGHPILLTSSPIGGGALSKGASEETTSPQGRCGRSDISDDDELSPLKDFVNLKSLRNSEKFLNQFEHSSSGSAKAKKTKSQGFKKYDANVKSLLRALKRSKCGFTTKNIVLQNCNDLPKAAGGFSAVTGIILCQDQIKSKEVLENTLVHELIHAFDWCTMQWNADNCKHQACSEVRASILSGECEIERELARLNFANAMSWKGFEMCVKRRAITSVRANPHCGDDDKAREAVDSVYAQCAKDTVPL
ncbi:Mitochondrial inner membrane protease atp23 [Blyttiomyces sp. JEL0837]|nr:Mitochondrial inner membrane protease atp23 [Blyttiomyces sp. JEL0837]